MFVIQEQQLKLQRELYDIAIQIYMEEKKRRENSDQAHEWVNWTANILYLIFFHHDYVFL